MGATAHKTSSPPHIFVLGPSGCGKSRIGKYFGRRDYLHVEIDRWPDGDGIDLEHLRTEWDEFYLRGTPKSLATALAAKASSARRRACVLTFPSGVVLSTPLIEAGITSSIVVKYLYGSAADCIMSFLHRESEIGRNLPVEHWLANNGCAYLQVSRPEFEPYRVAVFTGRGTRVSLNRIAEQMLAAPNAD